MWMTTYIQKIQKQLISKYGYKENPNKPGLPLNVRDGKYPMTIDGRLDMVEVNDGKISCCNFAKKNSRKKKQRRPPSTGTR